jgi:hypothetical protein
MLCGVAAKTKPRRSSCRDRRRGGAGVTGDGATAPATSRRSRVSSSLTPRAARHNHGPTSFRWFGRWARACRKTRSRRSVFAAPAVVGLGVQRTCRRQIEANGLPSAMRSGVRSRGRRSEDSGRRRGRRSRVPRSPPSGLRSNNGGAVLRGRLVEGGTSEDDALQPWRSSCCNRPRGRSWRARRRPWS